MRADHHNSHRRSTATGGTNERAVSVALVLLALPAAFAALLAAGAVVTTGPVGAGAVAVGLFTAPVLLPWLAVRGAVAVVERGQRR
jgi:hypothetical protein